MVKRILCGILWWVVIYFVACFITGALAAVLTGAQGAEAGAQAGSAAYEAFGTYIVLGSIVLTALGTWKGVLPGTKPELPRQ